MKNLNFKQNYLKKLIVDQGWDRKIGFFPAQ